MSYKEKIIETVNKLFNEKQENFIFIYTPPKVGSTTLVSSLRVSLGKSYNVIHLHDEIMLSVLSGINNITILDIIDYLSSINKNIFVIDIYRTPIERKISEFFEKISPYHFNNTEENINNYNINRIFNRFNKIFPYIENGDHYFDKYNISDPIPFDFKNKYTIQEKNNIKFIKLRLCDSDIWGNILSTILNNDIVIIEDYKTEEKPIGNLYKKFKDEYKIPLNYYNELENNKFLNYYYSNEEKIDYLNYWKNKLTDNFLPYTFDEYNFYMNLCLENQFIIDIQIDHYIDNGCFCNCCSVKRREYFFRAKKGEKYFEKIIHNKVNEEVKQAKIKNINKKINIINTFNHEIKKKIEKKQKKIIKLFT
jgi:hypothetical protein